jgi:hypothetical protein
MKSKSTILEAQGRRLPDKKNEKQCRVQKKRKRRRTEMGRPYVEGCKKDDSTTRWW